MREALGWLVAATLGYNVVLHGSAEVLALGVGFLSLFGAGAAVHDQEEK